MRFKKTNSSPYKDALLKEANGLAALSKRLSVNHINIKTPEIYQVDEHTLTSELINQLGGSNQQWQHFGQGLAQLHLSEAADFGWHENNYIGMNPQSNVQTDDWGQFFVNHRLAFQINLIQDQNTRKHFNQSLQAVSKALMQFLNKQCVQASFLHGDLWSGNVLFDHKDVWLIDPAVYCGDAEADLAMTELFGGFPVAFYQAYDRLKPQSNHYALKKVIYNLYHQLNHYNLFGAGYLAGCEHSFKVMAKHFS